MIGHSAFSKSIRQYLSNLDSAAIIWSVFSVIKNYRYHIHKLLIACYLTPKTKDLIEEHGEAAEDTVIVTEEVTGRTVDDVLVTGLARQVSRQVFSAGFGINRHTLDIGNMSVGVCLYFALSKFSLNLN